MSIKSKNKSEANRESPEEQAVKQIMGPTPENATSKGSEEAIKPHPVGTIISPDNLAELPQPTSAPLVSGENSVKSMAGSEVTDKVLPSIPDDKNTEDAVDDIANKESDAVLAAEDAEVTKAFEKDKPGVVNKIKTLIKRWWNNPKARLGTIIGLIAVVLALMAIPATRYFFLNTAGVRASTSVKVLDNSTGLPLKNVQVRIGNQSALTNTQGRATLEHVKLGRAQLVIEKRAFAVSKQPITVGWGSNPLGNFSLKAVGAQYAFTVTDFLSSKPITNAEASSGDASALSDKNGKILLTVDASDSVSLVVSIKASTYRDVNINFSTANKANQVIKMVPALRHVFISKRTGEYNLYKIDIDGNNEQLVLKGTGTERDDINVVPHPTQNITALISTRDNVRDGDGYLLSSLTIIDLSDDSTVSVTRSERIVVLGWAGDRIIYVKIAAGTSASNPNRQQLVSYNYKTGNSVNLASNNSFNDLIVIGNSVYYAQSSLYEKDPSLGLIKINTDGTNKQTIFSGEVWNIFRTDYNMLTLSVGQDWYAYQLNGKLQKLSGAPPNVTSRHYVDSLDGKQSAWVDTRDGKGVLLIHDVKKGTDKTLLAQSGLSNPIRWLNNSVLVYRIHTDQETADYAISTNGGAAHKIRDVTNTPGASQWNAY